MPPLQGALAADLRLGWHKVPVKMARSAQQIGAQGWCEAGH